MKKDNQNLDGIILMGPFGSGKSYLGRCLHSDGIAQFTELEPIVYDLFSDERAVTPDDIREIKAWLAAQSNGPIDIVIEGQTSGDDPDEARAIIQSWAEAGATWWIESVWDHPAKRANRLLQGPLPSAGT